MADININEALWFSPCPPEFEWGPWNEACEEIAILCGDPIIPLHHEDLNRAIRRIPRPPELHPVR